jgi:energy-coupling factor transporter ATP-binding protein EcfA2
MYSGTIVVSATVYLTEFHMRRHELVLERHCSQRTDDSRLKEQLSSIIERGLRGPRGHGWSHRLGKVEARKDGDYWVFTCKLSLHKTMGRKSAEPRQFASIVRHISSAGQLAKMGKFPWNITLIDDSKEGIPAPAVHVRSREEVVRSYFDKLNLSPGDHFSHLFNLDDQIEMGLDALRAAVESDFRNRFNVVYYGPPGCGKSEILKAMGAMLGPENEAWVRVDAPSTTGPGVQKLIIEGDKVPPVMFIEEIEKVPEQSLTWLLGIADVRAEVRKLNFRVTAAKSVKMVIMATVNNMPLFQRLAAGALASRFPNKIYCPRPNRETLAKILRREVTQTKGGRLEWIEPALDLAQEFNINDPREVIPICLCGGPKLLNGRYREMLQNVRRLESQEVKAS